MKKAASLVLALLLAAIMLWGGCLSCIPYAGPPGVHSKSCCDPAGGCKPAHSKPLSRQQCRIPAYARAKAPVAPLRTELAAFAGRPARAELYGGVPAARPVPEPPGLKSPHDLCLLHSVLRI